jgi:hypothetical protein
MVIQPLHLLDITVVVVRHVSFIFFCIIAVAMAALLINSAADLGHTFGDGLNTKTKSLLVVVLLLVVLSTVALLYVEDIPVTSSELESRFLSSVNYLVHYTNYHNQCEC